MNILRLLARAALLAAAWVMVSGAMTEDEAGYSFALLGDTPYSRFERKHLPQMLRDIAATGPAFVVHVGDMKSGGDACDDRFYQARLALFNAQPQPLILTPGDNDWTDCGRAAAGGFDPLERLEHLRQRFFGRPQSLGARPMAVERQSDLMGQDDPGFAHYRENLRWQRGPVSFATLHVVGSRDNSGPGKRPGEEYLARSRANGAWLAAAFAEARRRGSAALVLMMQADPQFEDYAAGRAPRAYRPLLDQLLRETLAYDGEVVVVHGDSHVQRIDHPLRDPAGGQPIKRFTRVETPGSPFMGWVQGTVRPGLRPTLVFRAFTWAPAQ
jgi:hypothetical protein